MTNSITATISFDFKGENLTPSTIIDLDDFIARELELSNIYSTIASQNQIGLYSYEYEVLMSSEIIFSHPKGAAQHFLNGSDFDFERFKQEHHEQKILTTLESIAQEHLQVDDLEQNPSLKSALLEAYRYGQESSQ